MSGKKILSVLPQIYDVATSNNNWTSALDSVAWATNARGVSLYASNNVDFVFTVVQTNSFYHDYPDEVLEYLSKYKEYDEEATYRVTQRSPFFALSDYEVWGKDVIQNGREDNEYLKSRFSIGRRYAFNISKIRELSASLSCHFEQSISQPDLEWIQNGALLSQHLGKALEINRFYSKLLEKYNAVLSALDRIDVGIILVQSNGELITKNKFADILLSDANPLRLTKLGSLEILDEDQNSELKHFVHECSLSAQGENGSVERVLRAAKPNGTDDLFIEVSPIRDGADELNEPLQGAMILILDPASPPPVDVSGFAAFYKLTPSEKEVTTLLVKGLSHTEIADARNVSPATIRNQIQSINAKTGARNRAILIRKLVTLSPPVK